MDSAWLTNLLAAMSLAVDDEIARASEAVAGHGASAPAALTTLRAEPGLSIEQLRGALRLTHSGGVRLVDRLARAGLVERGDGWGRRVELRLTPFGQETALRILDARERASALALAALNDFEQRQLATLAERMLRGLVVSEAQSWQICRLCDTQACPPDRCPVESELRSRAT